MRIRAEGTTEEEAAAITLALNALLAADVERTTAPQMSRWRVAARLYGDEAEPEFPH